MAIIYFEKMFQRIGIGSWGGGEGSPWMHCWAGSCCGQLRLNPEDHPRNSIECSWELLSKTEMEYLATGSQPKVKGSPNSLPSGRRASPVPEDTPDNRNKDAPGQKTKDAQCRWSEVLSYLSWAQVVAGQRPVQKMWDEAKMMFDLCSFLRNSYMTSESS